MRVSEVFGPTFQGEGATAGRPAVFLRTSGCNLDCTWCDTPYTWDWKRYDRATEEHQQTVSEVVTAVLELANLGHRLVVSGGEPLLQQDALARVLHKVRRYFAAVEVETNGTRPPTDEMVALVDQWNVSPKLPHSGVDPQRAEKLHVLHAYGRINGRPPHPTTKVQPTVQLKVVVDTTPPPAAGYGTAIAGQLATVETWRKAMQLPAAQVWVMPCTVPDGTGQDRQLRALAPHVLAHGFNLSPRLHLQVWGGERAR